MGIFFSIKKKFYIKIPLTIYFGIQTDHYINGLLSTYIQTYEKKLLLKTFDKLAVNNIKNIRTTTLLQLSSKLLTSSKILKCLIFIKICLKDLLSIHIQTYKKTYFKNIRQISGK